MNETKVSSKTFNLRSLVSSLRSPSDLELLDESIIAGELFELFRCNGSLQLKGLRELVMTDGLGEIAFFEVHYRRTHLKPIT